MTAHIHLVPRSIMRGAVPPLPQYAFMVWCSVLSTEKVHYSVLKNTGSNTVRVTITRRTMLARLVLRMVKCEMFTKL
jgi:uncharacterized protein (DUF111 family)